MTSSLDAAWPRCDGTGVDWWRRVLGFLLPHRRLETLPRVGRVHLRAEVMGSPVERSPFSGQEAVAFRWAFAVAKPDPDERSREPVHEVLGERCTRAPFRLRVGADVIGIEQPAALRWRVPETFGLLARLPDGAPMAKALFEDPTRRGPLLLSETPLFAGDPVELTGWVEGLPEDGGGYRAAARPGPAFRLRPDLGDCTLRDLSAL